MWRCHRQLGNVTQRVLHFTEGQLRLSALRISEEASKESLEALTASVEAAQERVHEAERGLKAAQMARDEAEELSRRLAEE